MRAIVFNCHALTSALRCHSEIDLQDNHQHTQNEQTK